MNEENKNLLSISKIAMRLGIDRGVVSKRLLLAGIPPDISKEKEKLYNFTSELEEILSMSDDEIDGLKKRKLAAEAELKELQIAEKRGEMLSTDEVKSSVIAIFSGLQKEIVGQIPKRVAGKLKKCTSIAEITATLKMELEQPFNDLRQDYSKFLQ